MPPNGMKIPARSTTWAVLLGCLALSSCQPPTYELTLSVNGGRLFFDAAFPGDWPFRWGKSEVQADYLEVVTSDEVLWAIKASESRDCTTPTENPVYREPFHLIFPLAFGATPRCFITLMPAKRLPQGKVILVRSKGNVTHGSGLFKIRAQQVEKVADGDGVGDRAPSLNPWW